MTQTLSAALSLSRRIEKALLSALAISVFSAFSANSSFATQDPSDAFCGGSLSAPQQSICADFRAASTVTHEYLPQVYSGECYYRSSMFDPEHAHYGLVVLDEWEDHGYVFGGEFSFFNPSNPYSSIDISTAREKGYVKYDDRHLITFNQDQAEVDFTTDPTKPWHYWLRENGSSFELYLLAQWGTTDQVFCRLGLNIPKP